MRILVTGATGNVGRRVVDHLLAAGATGVRALTVDPVKADLPSGVEVARGYLGKPETIPPALEGIDRMYLAPLPETVVEVIGMARQAGVSRIVDLSGHYESWWGTVATAVEESGLEWTHLWAGEFMPNATIWAGQIRRTGIVRDAFPQATNAPIDIDDIAAAAARALLSDVHTGKAYHLTGPEALSRVDLVERIGAALGKQIPFVEVSRDEAVELLTPIMGEYAAWYVDGHGELVEHPQPVSPDLENVLGCPPTTFAQWAAAHVDEFR